MPVIYAEQSGLRLWLTPMHTRTRHSRRKQSTDFSIAEAGSPCQLLLGPEVNAAEEALELNTNEAAQTGLTTIEP